jgi:hypothetical protein
MVSLREVTNGTCREAELIAIVVIFQDLAFARSLGAGGALLTIEGWFGPERNFPDVKIGNE